MTGPKSSKKNVGEDLEVGGDLEFDLTYLKKSLKTMAKQTEEGMEGLCRISERLN